MPTCPAWNDPGLELLDSAVALASQGATVGEAAAYLIAQRIPLLLRLRRTAEAARSLEVAERELGVSPTFSASHRADVHRYAGMIEYASGRAARAVERFRQAVALAEPAGDEGTVPGINSCLLGVGLVAVGRVGDAQEMLRDACARYGTEGMADPLVLQWIEEAKRR